MLWALFLFQNEIIFLDGPRKALRCMLAKLYLQIKNIIELRLSLAKSIWNCNKLNNKVALFPDQAYTMEHRHSIGLWGFVDHSSWMPVLQSSNNNMNAFYLRSLPRYIYRIMTSNLDYVSHQLWDYGVTTTLVNDQSQWPPFSLLAEWIPRCMCCATLVILAQTHYMLSHGQANEFPRILSQNGQNDLEGQSEWPPYTKMHVWCKFSDSSPNLQQLIVPAG